MRRQTDRIVKVLADPALKSAGHEQERQAAIRTIAEQIFDVGEVTRRTLGPHWRERDRQSFERREHDERSYSIT